MKIGWDAIIARCPWIKTSANEAPDSITGRSLQRKTVFIGVGSVMLMVLVIAIFLTRSQDKDQPPPSTNKSPITITTHDDSLQHWTVQTDSALTQVTQQLDQHLSESQQQGTQVQQLIQQLHTQGAALHKLQQDSAQQRHHWQASVTTLKAQWSRMMNRVSQQGDASQSSSAVMPASRQTTTVSPLTVYHSPEIQGSTTDKNQALVSNPYQGWLPMGSFFQATLLNGVVAPTGSAGSDNPVPVLMKVMSDAILPNDSYRYQLRGCFIMGSAYGSVSSERVAIRLDRIACIDHDGQALAAATIRGFVVDADGKTGLRGRLINRQGSKIAMATLAGFAGGISRMFGNAQGTSIVSPTGSGVSLLPSDKLVAAGLGGVGHAADTVAKFYVKQAEQIFPVIVINAGRRVTLDLTQGVQLRWRDIRHAKVPANELPTTTQSSESMS